MGTSGRDISPFVLGDDANIAVIGGGPSGSFFSFFALRMAEMVGKNISVTIFEPKDFTKDGPAGCNRCGGIISELLVQTLAVEGINLPESVIQRGINSYRLHTTQGEVVIETPAHERKIAAVYRGGGPKGSMKCEKESFDNFLLNLAIQTGAKRVPARINKVEANGAKPVIYSEGKPVMEADLVVGAVGIKSGTNDVFESMKFGYKTPEFVTTSISEISMEREVIVQRFGNAIQLFLLPIKGVKFAAMIPKETYVTICILGKDIGANTLTEFLAHPVVKAFLPETLNYKIACRCLPKMNVRAPEVAYADRIVMCGDAGSTRLFKDGLNAAYVMGKAAAKTAIFEGVSREHFEASYLHVYKSFITDNGYGSILYRICDLYRENKMLTRAMLETVRKEQADAGSNKTLSTVLWEMFTGNELYKNIFPKAMSLPIGTKFWGGITTSILRRSSWQKANSEEPTKTEK